MPQDLWRLVTGGHLSEKVSVIQRSNGLLMRAMGTQSEQRQMMTDRSSAWLARNVPTCATTRLRCSQGGKDASNPASLALCEPKRPANKPRQVTYS